jgi:plasmid stabilization system protein ParE
MGRRTTNPDIRILPPSRYSYRIYYSVLQETVIILHVRHTSRSDPELPTLGQNP